MHHGSSVVKMDDFIFMLFYSFYFFHLLFFMKICFRNELTNKKMCLRPGSNVKSHMCRT